MLATKSPGYSAPSKLLGTPGTELTFRIQGGEHHGRIVRISGAKCTIGSAAGCTLRLRRNDIEPLHCLILMGRNGTLVRRNSPRTYLNGGAFEDALLQAGDVLQIGGVELVLVACPQASKLPQAPAQTESFPDQMRQNLDAQVTLARQQAQEQVHRLEQELSGQQSENSRRARELAELGEQLRAARDEVDAQRAASLDREERLRNELQEARDLAKDWEARLAARETSWQQQTEAGTSEVQSLRKELSNQQESREQEQQEFSARRQEWDVKLETQRCELVRRQEECDGAAEQLASLQNLLQETRQQFQQREAQQLADQQRAAEEAAGVINRLEGNIALLTENLHEREAQAVAATQQESESTLALALDLDNARRELHELRLRHSQEDLERTGFQATAEGQIADLTTRLMEREKALSGRDHELAELRQQLAHFGAEEQMLRHLEANLATAEAAHQAERELCRVERLGLESQRAELETQRIALTSGQGELETRQNELATRQHEVETVRSDLAGQQRELESQRSELAARQSEGESQRSELEAQRGSLAAQRSELELQTTALDAQRESLLIQQNELLAQANLHQETTRRCAAFEAELTELRSRPQPAWDHEAAAMTPQEQTAHQHDEQVEKWQSEAHKWQLQAEEVAGQLGDFKHSCARLKDEINELRGAGRPPATEAPSERPNVDATREELEAQRNDLDAARNRLQEEQTRIETVRTELSSREEALARFDVDLRERQNVWESSREEQSRALEERSQLITMQIAQFEAEQTAYARQQATMIQQMTTLEDRVQELTTASESRANEVASPPAAEFAPAQVASGVDRLAQSENWQGPEVDDELSDAAAESPTLDAPQGSNRADQETPAAVHQDEDSIEQYMSRLLNRVRGGDSPAASPAPLPVWRSEAASPAPTIAPAPAPENAGQQKVYVPRVPAPEQPGRLSEMRELANSAANSAIHTHARRKQSRQTKHKSLVALLSLIGAIGLFTAGFFTGSYLALAGAAIFMSVCCVMSLRAILGGLKQLRLKRPREIANAPAQTGSAPNQEEAIKPR